MSAGFAMDVARDPPKRLRTPDDENGEEMMQVGTLARTTSLTPPLNAISLRMVPNPVRALSVHLTQTMQRCKPDFKCPAPRPGRMLSNPSEGTRNDGYDNEDANLICRVNDVLTAPQHGAEYRILDMLGQGTFGQVFRCQEMSSRRFVAVKVVKNKPAYTAQAKCEIKIAHMLTNLSRASSKPANVVRLLGSFSYKGHLCLVFEELGTNLYELLKQNQFRGLPLSLVRTYVKQILQAMALLQDNFVIHCDLKPENILLEIADEPSNAAVGANFKKKYTPQVIRRMRENRESEWTSFQFNGTEERGLYLGHRGAWMVTGGDENNIERLKGMQAQQKQKIGRRRKRNVVQGVRVIDFGSACFEGQTIFSYIQSRFYRSPEVLLGLPYDRAIDMWSLGCICAELFLGLPILPGSSEHNQISRILSMLGPIPRFMLKTGRNTKKFFRASDKDDGFTLLTPEEHAKKEGKPMAGSRRYFRYDSLKDIIINYPMRRSLGPEEITLERRDRECFIHFCLKLLNPHPRERYTAKQALTHPFITGEPFDAAFEPPKDPRLLDQSLTAAMAEEGAEPPEEPLRRRVNGNHGQHREVAPSLSRTKPQPVPVAVAAMESSAKAAMSAGADGYAGGGQSALGSSLGAGTGMTGGVPIPFGSGPSHGVGTLPRVPEEGGTPGAHHHAFSYSASNHHVMGSSDFGFAVGQRPERPSPVAFGFAPGGFNMSSQPAFVFGSPNHSMPLGGNPQSMHFNPSAFNPGSAFVTTPDRHSRARHSAQRRRNTSVHGGKGYPPASGQNPAFFMGPGMSQFSGVPLTRNPTMFYPNQQFAASQPAGGPGQPGLGYASSMPEHYAFGGVHQPQGTAQALGRSPTDADLASSGNMVPFTGGMGFSFGMPPAQEEAHETGPDQSEMLVVGPGNLLRKRHSMPVDMNLRSSESNAMEAEVYQSSSSMRSRFVPLAPAPREEDGHALDHGEFAEETKGSRADRKAPTVQSNPNLRALSKESDTLEAVWDPFFQEGRS